MTDTTERATPARRRDLKGLAWLVALALIATGVIAKAAGQSEDDPVAVAPAPSEVELPEVDLAIERYELANGLEVVLHQDNTLPSVATNIWYHVGTADEPPGKAGLAHLFEHLMFDGSGHVPEGAYDQFLDAVGSYNNASTGPDFTNYYIGDLPAEELGLALWLQADQMGFLLDGLDQTSAANQKAVVRNERRDNIDTAPYGVSDDAMMDGLFEGHPYRHLFGDDHTQVENLTMDDLRGFFRRYYVPNNATLVVAGNIDVAGTKALIEKYFGTIPRGADVPQRDIETPKITSQRRIKVTDEVDLDKVTMAWMTPPAFQPGDAEAELFANLLAGSPAGRLDRELVRGRQILQSVSAYQYSASYPSFFVIEAVGKRDVSVDEIEKAIDAELDAQGESGPDPADLVAAQTLVVSERVRALQEMADRADWINHYNHYAGDPDFLSRDIERYGSVTPQRMQAFVAQTLGPDARVVVHTTPGKKKLGPDPEPGPTPRDDPPGTPGEPWRNQKPGPGSAPGAQLPAIHSFEVGDGLPVHLVESHTLPVVAASLVSRAAGSAQDPPNRPGLAHFTNWLMNEGTADLDADEIADVVAGLGAESEVDAGKDFASVTMTSLTPQAEAAIALGADFVRRPAFRKADVERARDSILVDLGQEQEDPETLASNLVQPVVYGEDHPYGHQAAGTESSVKRVTQAELRRFWSSAWTPANSALVIAGDLSPAGAAKLARDAYGDWTGPPATELRPPGLPTDAPAERVFLVDVPEAAQTAFEVAQPLMARSDPEYERFEAVNQVIGGLFSSRLNANLREDKGWAYGAYSGVGAYRGVGLWGAEAQVETEHTGPSVKEVLAEVRRIREKPVTDEELGRAKASLIRSVPGLFSTAEVALATVSDLVTLGLPTGYYSGFAERVASLTVADLMATAAKHLAPDRLKLVAVGDRKVIEPQLQPLGLGTIAHLKPDGSRAGK